MKMRCFSHTFASDLKKPLALMALCLFMPSLANAQSGTNSPYSQYGLGTLADRATGFNRGMNGLGYGFHDGGQVNYSNPASYAYVDSLTFIFDMGLSGQMTNFSENGTKRNANNADFEYAVASFRLRKHLGASFGIVPVTNVGYDYSATEYVNGRKSVTYTNTYSGSGGLHQVYVGLGWAPFKGFSVGVNGGYLWGSIDRSVVNSYSDQNVNTLSKYYSAEVHSYTVQGGLQYTQKLSKTDDLTFGLTYSLGHKIGGKPTCRVISNNPQTSVADTTEYGGNSLKLEIPTELGAGFLYNHENKLRFGFDYTLTKWSDCSFPVYKSLSETEAAYVMTDDYFKDRHKFTVGVDYNPESMSRRFLKRLHYRAGASYATPYMKINGKDGPKELSVSAGLGIPLVNKWNNRSSLNLSFQWVHNSADKMITENMFRVNIGITFNERWFAKWKVE